MRANNQLRCSLLRQTITASNRWSLRRSRVLADLPECFGNEVWSGTTKPRMALTSMTNQQAHGPNAFPRSREGIANQSPRPVTLSAIHSANTCWGLAFSLGEELQGWALPLTPIASLGSEPVPPHLYTDKGIRALIDNSPQTYRWRGRASNLRHVNAGSAAINDAADVGTTSADGNVFTVERTITC